MVAHLSQSHPDRWVTWVNPGAIDRQTLEHYGVNTKRIRLIHAANPRDVRWIAWEAMATGTSHTVIAAPGKLTRKDVQLLEEAAQRGLCQGLRSEEHTSELQSRGQLVCRLLLENKK